jgi:hypothetical protein
MRQRENSTDDAGRALAYWHTMAAAQVKNKIEK